MVPYEKVPQVCAPWQRSVRPATCHAPSTARVPGAQARNCKLAGPIHHCESSAVDCRCVGWQGNSCVHPPSPRSHHAPLRPHTPHPRPPPLRSPIPLTTHPSAPKPGPAFCAQTTHHTPPPGHRPCPARTPSNCRRAKRTTATCGRPRMSRLLCRRWGAAGGACKARGACVRGGGATSALPPALRRSSANKGLCRRARGGEERGRPGLCTRRGCSCRALVPGVVLDAHACVNPAFCSSQAVSCRLHACTGVQAQGEEG
jgi:hypothetical protein